MSGGLTSGVCAAFQGRNVWTGELVKSQTLITPNNYTFDVDESVMYMAKRSYGSNYSKPYQNHHFATDKHSYYTPRFKQLISKLGLKLNDSWNIERLPHQGRHPHYYHDWVYKKMDAIIKAPEMGMLKGLNRQLFFIRQFQQDVILPIRQNPEMLYKKYWINLYK